LAHGRNSTARNGARHQSEMRCGCFSCDEQRRENMENFSDHIVAYGIWTVVVIVLIFLIRAANVIRYIPNNQVGIVEIDRLRKFSY